MFEPKATAPHLDSTIRYQNGPCTPRPLVPQERAIADIVALRVCADFVAKVFLGC
jgi:hypothetical protein